MLEAGPSEKSSEGGESLPPHGIRGTLDKPHHGGQVWRHTRVSPGRVIVGKSFSLISLGFLNQAFWALLREPQATHFVRFHFANTDWFLSHRMVGSRVGNVIALRAAPLICVQSCFGKVSGGWASKSQPITAGSTSQGGEAYSFVPDPLSLGRLVCS